MPPSDMILAFIVVAASGAVVPYLAYRRAAARIRQLEERLRPAPEGDPRIEQLQNAVEALIDRSDQLAEGQEFLNRILSERLPREIVEPRPGPLPRVITPH